MGLQIVRAQNLRTHPGSPSGPGEQVGDIVSKSLKRELSVITEETRNNAIVEYLDYQIPVTQLKGPKEMEMCKQQSEVKMRHLPAVDRF